METFTAPAHRNPIFQEENAGEGPADYCARCGMKYDGTNAREACRASTITETRGDSKQRKAAFNAAVDEVLGQAITISNQRGGEYADSWALENQQTRFLDMVQTEITQRKSHRTLSGLSSEEKRLIMVACLCDVKMSRMIGGFKGDTLDDLINYVAALRKWLGDYVMKNDNAGEQAV